MDAPVERASSEASSRLEDVARALRRVLDGAPDTFPDALRARLQKVSKVLERREIIVVVSGLFKAGKSTLINRLARQELLPSGSLPETGAPALLRRRSPASAIAVKRGGAEIAIKPTPQAIAEHTSLYEADGERRSIEKIARRVEIAAPRLDIGPSVTLVDLPGLRDTPEMDEVALEIATEADIILWVFRSEPAFSEQDSEFLTYLVAMCGPHVVQLVLNAMTEAKSVSAWNAFMQTTLPVHRTALTKSVGAIGLSQEHIDKMCVVDAMMLRKRWFGVTFGGRTLFKLLSRVAKRSDEQVKLARFVRVAAALDVCAGWTASAAAAEQEKLTMAEALHRTYLERTRRREEIRLAVTNAVKTAFAGMDQEISTTGAAAAAQVSEKNYSVGAEKGGPIVDGAASVISARVKRLIAELSSISGDPESVLLSPENAAKIEQAFLPNGAGEASARERVRSLVGSVTTQQPKFSFDRVVSWFKGRDSEVEAAASSTRSALRSAASRVATAMSARASDVDAVVHRALAPPPLTVVPAPDPSALQELEAFSALVVHARQKASA